MSNLEVLCQSHQEDLHADKADPPPTLYLPVANEQNKPASAPLPLDDDVLLRKGVSMVSVAPSFNDWGLAAVASFVNRSASGSATEVVGMERDSEEVEAAKERLGSLVL